MRNELAETRSRLTIEKDTHELRERAVESAEENQILRSEITAKNERLKDVTRKLLAALPSDMANREIEVVLHSIVAIVGIIDELADLELGEAQPWRYMIANLPLWCDCIVQIEQSEKTAKEHVRLLEARIMELESHSVDTGKLSSDVIELEAKLNTLNSERDQVIASLKVRVFRGG